MHAAKMKEQTASMQDEGSYLTYKSTEQASDLNLVNGLLVFLLSRFEKTFGVINHLFQTVLLLKTNTDMEIYMR